MNEVITVLDYGGQYKELIARVIRGLSVYAEILPGGTDISTIKSRNPHGIILTGGPGSAYLENSPRCDPKLFDLGIPILGICYGMQMMCQILGGRVESSGAGEFGCVPVTPHDDSALFDSYDSFLALMSHTDSVSALPKGFTITAASQLCPIAACENKEKKLYGVQFHPETAHTKGGVDILRRFLFDICSVSGDYRPEDYIEAEIERIQKTVGSDNKVLLALSGGVDSSVAAAILSEAIPDRLICIFVDHGFMRLGECDDIERIFSKLNLQFVRVNAAHRFLNRIKGVSEPELKRKLIGDEFIRVFEEEAKKYGNIPFLAQGTIYPDIVESGGIHGAVIKSHHNVGGLPDNLNFKNVIEPLSGLFKDEVRIIGKKFGLPTTLINRQPFPGPGLAIRIIGEVSQHSLDILRLADAILRQEIEKLDQKPHQYFAVLTDTCSVGVKGDDRTYNRTIAIRCIDTDDFMTCVYSPLSHSTLRRISSRISSEIPEVSRVVYDISDKPPATVEWE